MRVAFYAPLKPPTHGTPSGDRRVARLLVDALALAGHDIELASDFRSYEGSGDAARQAALRDEGEARSRALVKNWLEKPDGKRPELWFTYHLYYKAPDWLGPLAAAALGIPYVLAEASHAPKRAGGPWAIGHEATARALRGAARVFSLSRDDIAGLEPLVAKERLSFLAPFLDPAPYAFASSERSQHRARFSRQLSLPDEEPWIAVAAMMREGDKLASYRALAGTLARVADLPWRLLVAGDGPARKLVEHAFASFRDRVRFLGALEEDPLARLYAACDLMVWPAVNEAFGMALLEAQAAGLPVVATALRGVPDVVVDGRTGLLAASLDEAELASRVRRLILDEKQRVAMGREAASFVRQERTAEVAARSLRQLP
ncbi:MAG: glycosyltransferase family 4 protein [Betaproteobacteria bacterium]